MGHKYGCESALGDMFVCDTLTPELSEHLATCEKCAAEYQKLLKTKELISLSAPKTPNLKKTVMERITRDGITIKDPEKPRRRFIPFGTIAAAAAVFVIYLSVQGTGVFDMLMPKSENLAANDADASSMMADEKEKTTSAGSGALTFGTYRAYDFDSAEQDEAVTEAAPESEAVLYSETQALKSSVNAAILAKPKGDAVLTDCTDDIQLCGAQELFENYDRLYPGRIERALFEQVGDATYIAFIEQITDFDLQYTSEALQKFAENNQ